MVLKRLGQALSDGDTVHAVILGSTQASKGRTAKAIIAPSVDGYLQVINRACANAGVAPEHLGYVEAHGNAAPIGDTIELQAIGAAIGARRPPGHPCRVGSIKSNIGHPEAAGGLAGLMKAAMVVRHRSVPASLHCPQPTSSVDWDRARHPTGPRPPRLGPTPDQPSRASTPTACPARSSTS